MLITLCYVYLWVRFQKFYTPVIRGTVQRLCGSSNLSSFTFCAVKPDQCQSGDQTSTQHKSTTPEDSQVFLKLGNKAIYITEPKACDDISKWTLLIGSSLFCRPRIESIAFIIEATSGPNVDQTQNSQQKVLKWSDYCNPLACCPGQPFRAVAETSLDNFSQLGVAFMEDRLQMEDGLVPEKIVSVLLQESTLRDLVQRSEASNGKHLSQQQQLQPLALESSTAIVLSEASPKEKPLDGFPLGPELLNHRKGSLNVSVASEPTLRRRSEGECRDFQEKEPVSLGTQHHMEGHHLHLSSCHECLELEHSTILSVKYASIENIPDLPHDCDYVDSDEGTDEMESFVGQSKRVNVSGKPPNVLVYTGSCTEHFETIRRLLAECIDTDSYTLYPIRPQHVLSEPWLENTLLLVLAADEALTPQLQERFLAYLDKGGRILGLSSTFSLAGLNLVAKEAQRNQISRLNFTKADSTELELSVLASGKVYVREPADCVTGEVELWGELQGDVKDMVIVRVTHGSCGGEAVLCQVRLETPPESQHVQSPGDFDMLKMSNALRYEVLTEILTSLGLSCELSQVPPPSPVHILSTCQELKGRLVKWLESQQDKEGLLRSPKSCLKLMSSAELQSTPDLPEGVVALLPEPPQGPLSEQFNLQTYSCHLQTHTLGRTLLYAEVTPTTMDLLEGLMLQLPEEMGLIAIALRQTKGKGRGGNTWLSPLGCAMFTQHVQVPIGSPLGSRIPFLQHLVALAVVEAVCTLPGYEKLDLKVKWPNDIYYSNLMKLGGVLVNSTIMGSTFHLLVGCGFNVSNSNPTICINDLVVQHNRDHGTSLEPLNPTQLIACAVTHLEQLIDDFQERGPSAVLPLYYKRWIHSGSRVRLWSEDGPEAEVVGLDDHGFLQVRTEDKQVVSVQPDGNSFDMLRNLVITKHS